MARLDFEHCSKRGEECLWNRLTLQDSQDIKLDPEEFCAECQCSLADLEAYSIQIGKRLEQHEPEKGIEPSGLKQARKLVQDLFESPEELISESNAFDGDDSAVESWQLGDYQLIRELGRGGMGVVYEAHQLTLDRSVALKVLPRRVIPNHQSSKRFQREATAAASLHHTNIVPVFDSGYHDGAWFYAMQLIDGESLDRIRSQLQETSSQAKNSTINLANEHTVSDRQLEDASASPTNSLHGVAGLVDSHIASDEIFLPPHFRFVADVGRQTASALGHAHDRGIIHRDVKPANLILDREGVVWLADFGLAKTAEEDLTMTSQAPGTLRYMSPERFKGAISVSGDVYSLGVTLYELLTLEKPFPAENQLELLNQIRSLEPKSPRQINPRIPLDLQTIVQKAMDKNPQRRYATAAAMQEDLERFLDGRPIAARKVSAGEKLWIWAQKNKPLATSLFAIFMLLAVGGAVSSLAAFKFRNQSEANLQLANEKSELAAAKQLETDEAKRQRDIAFKNAYFADMRQAQQDWRNGQLRRMLTTLREYLPTVPDSDVRGWEWYYLLSLAHKDQIAISDFEGVVTQTRWNKTGDALVGVTKGGFGVWDNRGRSQRNVKTGEFVDASISSDGNEVATVVENSVLKIWRVKTGQLARTFRFDDADLELAEWSATDNRIALYCHYDGRSEIKIVNSETGSVTGVISTPPTENPKLKLSPDGRHILFARKYELRVYNIESQEIVNEIQTTDFFSFQPMCMAWHPDSLRFAVGAYLQGARLFKMDETSRKPKLLKQLDGNSSVDAVQFSGDGETFAIGNRSQVVRLYDVESQQIKREFKGHLSAIRSVTLHSDNRFASSSDDGTIRIWKSNQTPEADSSQPTETAMPARRYSFGPLPDGRLRFKDRMNGTVRDFVGHGKRNSMPNGFPIARLSPSGLMGASCANGEVKIWDLETCQEIATFVGHRPNGWMSALEWSNTERFVASASIDQTIKIWDVQRKQLHATLQGQQGTTLSKIEFSFDDSRLSARDAISCRVWDTDTGREVLSFDADQPESRFSNFHLPVNMSNLKLDATMIRFDSLRKVESLSGNAALIDKFQHESRYELAKQLLRDPMDPLFDLDRGTHSAESALELLPGDPNTLFLRSFAHYLHNEFPQALQNLELAIDSGLERPVFEPMLAAICLKKSGQLESASEKYEQGLKAYEANLEDIYFRDLWFVNHVAGEFIRMNTDLGQFKPVVNTLSDEIDGVSDGSISLREALFLAPPGEKIAIQVEGDMKLRLGQVEIKQAISIEGPGVEKMSIIAAPNSRIFMVDDQDSNTFGEVRLSDMTLTKGRIKDSAMQGSRAYGGAIYCKESLICSNVHFVNNHALSRGGAVGVEDGKAEFSFCYFEGNYGRAGAAILGWNSILRVSSSQFRNNHSNYGGAAIFSYGNGNHFTKVQNCTFSGNHCNHRTNGIITNRNTSAEYLHCTIVDHRNHGFRLRADEGKAGGVVIKNCILTGNGTGVHEGCDLIIQPEHVDVNVISSIVGTVTGPFPRGEGNQFSTDPMLVPLADHGGPTQTFALLDSSPAIDAGAKSELMFDQRGKPNVRAADGDGDQVSAPDIGAFERQR